MPYIPQDERDAYKEPLKVLVKAISDLYLTKSKAKPVCFPGQLNYIITQLLLTLYPEARYQEYNEIIGILECCKLEFYRMQAAPYEDQKVKENGDVIPFFADYGSYKYLHDDKKNRK